MKTYTGKGKTLEAALQTATQSAIADSGPDTMIHYTLKEINGIYGGIAGLDEKEVIIQAEEPVQQELCSDVQGYKAYQSKEAVLVIAHGTHPTAGYQVWLEKSALDIWPPQFSVKHTEPTEPALQVITPFMVEASFEASKPIKTVKVEDAKGIHNIHVEPMEL